MDSQFSTTGSTSLHNARILDSRESSELASGLSRQSETDPEQKAKLELKFWQHQEEQNRKFYKTLVAHHEKLKTNFYKEQKQLKIQNKNRIRELKQRFRVRSKQIQKSIQPELQQRLKYERNLLSQQLQRQKSTYLSDKKFYQRIYNDELKLSQEKLEQILLASLKMQKKKLLYTKKNFFQKA